MVLVSSIISETASVTHSMIIETRHFNVRSKNDDLSRQKMHIFQAIPRASPDLSAIILNSEWPVVIIQTR